MNTFATMELGCDIPAVICSRWILLIVGLAVLVRHCQAQRWVHQCTGEEIYISCQLDGNDYLIRIEDAEYGLYDDRGCISPACCMPQEEDCRERVEDLYPGDYEEIVETCDGKTDCIVVVNTANLDVCEPSSDFLVVYYHCTDNGVVITPLPPTTQTLPKTTTIHAITTTLLPTEDQEEDETNIGLIIGIILGALVLFAIIGIISYLIYRYQRTKKDPSPHVVVEPNYTYDRNPADEEWRMPPPSKRLSVAFAYDNNAYEDELKITTGKTTQGSDSAYENAWGGSSTSNGAVAGQPNGDIKTASGEKSAYQVPGNRASVASNASAYTALSEASALPDKPALNDSMDDSVVKRASIASNSSWASSLGGRSSVTGAADAGGISKRTSLAASTIPEEVEDTIIKSKTDNDTKSGTPTDKQGATAANGATATSIPKYENVNSQQGSQPVKPKRNSKLGSQGNLSRMSLASIGQSYETIGSQATSVATEATVGHYEDVEVKP